MRQVVDKFIAGRKNTVLVVADMGRFPLSKSAGNLIDVGLSESLMVNVAAGLSLAGKEVYIYTVAGFTLYRALEQLKVCFQMKTTSGAYPMNLHILNGGSGFLYNQCGLGHYLVDDISLVQNLLPSFKIAIPFDERSTLASLELTSFNTQNVINMKGMFDNCQSLLSLNLLSFNTENVTNMEFMF